MATARDSHTATLLPNGKVLAVAGFGVGGYRASAELYDPGSGTWTATGGLATARYFHTATLLPNGKVLVTGGYRSGYISSSEIYSPTVAANSTCRPDIDGDGFVTATTDALILLRVAMGINGSAVIAGINLPATAMRNTWPLIRDYLVTQCGFSLP